MASQPQSQYQSVFKLNSENVAQQRGRVTKRNRATLSCMTCKLSKLKCDRQAPCSSCSNRGLASSCSLLSDSKIQGANAKKVRSSEAQVRLQKLEELVEGLMHGRDSASLSDTQPANPLVIGTDSMRINRSSSPLTESPSNGVLKVNGSQTEYRGATHWATILGNIRDIQECFDNEEEEDNGESIEAFIPDGMGLDGRQPMTRTQILEALPPRAEVDKLLSTYFSAEYFNLPVIHTIKFMREYHTFWRDNSSTSLLWLSILFCMLSLASQVDEYSGSSIPKPKTSSFYLFTLAGQALSQGQYQKAKPLSVEAVLFYGLCRLWQPMEDKYDEVWMIMGIGARLALKLGYHRDPRHLPNLSPFQGEMRRRVFGLVSSFDTLISFQSGLPAVINEDDCDTAAPSNLCDHDFDEESNILPPPRPMTDHNSMVYYVFKVRLIQAFQKIIRHTSYEDLPDSEETWKLDTRLREVHNEVPPALRLRPIQLCITDKIHKVLHRLNLELTYQKALCVLHRRYFQCNMLNSVFESHRKICLDASLCILDLQAELHNATQPDGIFYKERWMLSSISLHDFLMAAMITCLQLYELQHIKSGNEECIRMQQRGYEALERSHLIWKSRRDTSKDARRATNILAVMLAKVSKPQYLTSGLVQPVSNFQQTVQSDSSATNGTQMEQPWPSSADTNIYDQTTNDSWANMDVSNPVNNFIEFTNNNDWGFIDQYLLGYNDESSH